MHSNSLYEILDLNVTNLATKLKKMSGNPFSYKEPDKVHRREDSYVEIITEKTLARCKLIKYISQQQDTAEQWTFMILQTLRGIQVKIMLLKLR